MSVHLKLAIIHVYAYFPIPSTFLSCVIALT